MSEQASSAWTTHGHPIPGETITGTRPTRVARCGGPMICGKCKLEVMAAAKASLAEANIHLVENKSGRPEPILTGDEWDSIKGAPRAMTAITVTTTSEERLSNLERDEWQYPEAAALALAQAPGQLLALARVQEYVTADKYQGGIEHVYEWTFIPKAV